MQYSELNQIKAVLHEVLTAELAAARQGTTSTLTRRKLGEEENLSNKKELVELDKDQSEPLMVGGGVTFGPKPKSFEKKKLKKVRRLALISALSEK